MRNGLLDVLGDGVVRLLARPHQVGECSPEIVVVGLEVLHHILRLYLLQLSDVVGWCLAHCLMVCSKVNHPNTKKCSRSLFRMNIN